MCMSPGFTYQPIHLLCRLAAVRNPVLRESGRCFRHMHTLVHKHTPWNYLKFPVHSTVFTESWSSLISSEYIIIPHLFPSSSTSSEHCLSPMSSCYLLCLIHWKWGLLSIGTTSVSSEHITSQITAFVNHSHSICTLALTSLLLDWFLERTCDSFAPNPTVVFHTSMPSSLSIASLPPHLPMLSLGNGILMHTWSWTLWHPNHNCKFFSVHGTLLYSRATVLVEVWNFIQMLISSCAGTLASLLFITPFLHGYFTYQNATCRFLVGLCWITLPLSFSPLPKNSEWDAIGHRILFILSVVNFQTNTVVSYFSPSCLVPTLLHSLLDWLLACSLHKSVYSLYLNRAELML